jgi:hypothetical protein
MHAYVQQVLGYIMYVLYGSKQFSDNLYNLMSILTPACGVSATIPFKFKADYQVWQIIQINVQPFQSIHAPN